MFFIYFFKNPDGALTSSLAYIIIADFNKDLFTDAFHISKYKNLLRQNTFYPITETQFGGQKEALHYLITL